MEIVSRLVQTVVNLDAIRTVMANKRVSLKTKNSGIAVQRWHAPGKG